MSDLFDPNTWDLSTPEFRMYADAYANASCLVDEEDYQYFTRWMWCLKIDRRGKRYFRRAISRYEGGERAGSSTVYLHVEILTRAEGPPPTRLRCVADHLNGDSFDNRRENLRWATKAENNWNRFGRGYRELRLGL